MKKNSFRRIALTGLVGAVTVLGTTTLVSAQRRGGDWRKDQGQQQQQDQKSQPQQDNNRVEIYNILREQVDHRHE